MSALLPEPPDAEPAEPATTAGQHGFAGARRRVSREGRGRWHQAELAAGIRAWCDSASAPGSRPCRRPRRLGVRRSAVEARRGPAVRTRADQGDRRPARDAHGRGRGANRSRDGASARAAGARDGRPVRGADLQPRRRQEFIYTSPKPLTYVRAAVTVDRIEGDAGVALTTGRPPAPGRDRRGRRAVLATEYEIARNQHHESRGTNALDRRDEPAVPVARRASARPL